MSAEAPGSNPLAEPLLRFLSKVLNALEGGYYEPAIEGRNYDISSDGQRLLMIIRGWAAKEDYPGETSLGLRFGGLSPSPPHCRRRYPFLPRLRSWQQISLRLESRAERRSCQIAPADTTRGNFLCCRINVLTISLYLSESCQQ